MYPRNAQNPLKEQMILQGELEPTNEGYAIAKIGVAKLCEYICKSNSARNYKTIIPCNLYGKYDKYDPAHSHMIPAVIKKLDDAKNSNQAVISIWGDGTARREFMSASDLADFIFYAVDKTELLPQYMNVGLGYDYSILDYYKEISEVVGYDGEFNFDTSKPVGMKQKLVDISKLESFGWRHNLSLREGLIEAYQFYKLGQS